MISMIFFTVTIIEQLTLNFDIISIYNKNNKIICLSHLYYYFILNILCLIYLNMNFLLNCRKWTDNCISTFQYVNKIRIYHIGI